MKDDNSDALEVITIDDSNGMDEVKHRPLPDKGRADYSVLSSSRKPSPNRV